MLKTFNIGNDNTRSKQNLNKVKTLEKYLDLKTEECQQLEQRLEYTIY